MGFVVNLALFRFAFPRTNLVFCPAGHRKPKKSDVTKKKTASQETGDFPGGDVARNGFTSDMPGHPGIPDTNDVCNVL